MRIVCYAQGGGLGHLTRIRAYLHTVHGGQPATILSTSPFAADPRVAGDCRVLCAPPGADLAAWTADTLHRLSPDELVVDAFPAGLHGELAAGVVPGLTRVVHLARLLRWDAYRSLLPRAALRFDQTWLVEPVTDEHHAYLASASRAVLPLDLVEPEAGDGPPGAPHPPAGGISPGAPYPPGGGRSAGGWLIVHSGPADEVLELVSYAREVAAIEGVRPRLTLVSPSPLAELPPEVAHLDAYPVLPLVPYAARIITAAGCNAVRQLLPWRSRHRMIPFFRRYDDQFARARRVLRGR